MSRYALLTICFILISCNNSFKITSQSMFKVIYNDFCNKKDRKQIESYLDKNNIKLWNKFISNSEFSSILFGNQAPKIENIEIKISGINSFISKYFKFSSKLGPQILTLTFQDIKIFEFIKNKKFNKFFCYEKTIPKELKNLIYKYYIEAIKEENSYAELIQVKYYLDNNPIKAKFINLKKWNFIDFKKNVIDLKINQKDQCEFKSQNYLVFSSNERNIKYINFDHPLWFSHSNILFWRIVINGKVAFCVRANSFFLH